MQLCQPHIGLCESVVPRVTHSASRCSSLLRRAYTPSTRLPFLLSCCLSITYHVHPAVNTADSLTCLPPPVPLAPQGPVVLRPLRYSANRINISASLPAVPKLAIYETTTHDFERQQLSLKLITAISRTARSPAHNRPLSLSPLSYPPAASLEAAVCLRGCPMATRWNMLHLVKLEAEGERMCLQTILP